jgi:DNA-binding IclR family transcriptional regulator
MSGTELIDGEAAAAVSASSDLASVDVVLSLLELLAAAPRPMGVTEVAGALQLSKPRTHRHLRALVQRGYARQDPASGGYEVGVRVLTLGEAARERFDVMSAIRPVMASLRAATGLAVTASALVGDEVVVLEVLQGTQLIDFGVRPGSRLDLHASAHGLVALAFGPANLLDQALASPLHGWTEHTLVDAVAVRAEVERVRQRGWATADGGVQLGVNALAAPVVDHRGVALGAVALVGASQFIAAEPEARQVAAVREAAAAASRNLGGRLV